MQFSLANESSTTIVVESKRFAKIRQFLRHFKSFSFFVFERSESIAKFFRQIKENSFVTVFYWVAIASDCSFLLFYSRNVTEEDNLFLSHYYLNFVLLVIYCFEVVFKTVPNGFLLSIHRKNKTKLSKVEVDFFQNDQDDMVEDTINGKYDTVVGRDVPIRNKEPILNSNFIQRKSLSKKGFKRSKTIFKMNSKAKTQLEASRKARVQLENIQQANSKIERAYLLYFWNVFDFCMTILLLFVVFSGKNMSLMVFVKVLAPLRFVNKSKELQKIIRNLVETLPALVNVFFIGFLFLLIFAVFGVNLFKGRVGKCSVAALEDRIACETAGAVWTPASVNMDTVLSALLVLFQMASTDSWQEYAISITSHTNSGLLFFFALFMVVGAMIIMYLIVTVVIDNYISFKEKEDGISFLTPKQTLWVALLTEFLRYQPDVHISSAKRLPLFKAITQSFKQNSEFIEIAASIFSLFLASVNAFSYYLQSPELERFQGGLINMTAIYFLIEMTIKLVAFKNLFFRISINSFDLFAVTSLCSAALVRHIWLDLDCLEQQTKLVAMTKVAASLRVLRILFTSKLLKKTLKNIIWLLPSLKSISMLILILILIFVPAAVHCFKNAEMSQEITRAINFYSFKGSFTALLKCLTLDGCSNLVRDLAEQHEITGLSYRLTICFFLFFIFTVSIVVMNIFLAVVVNSYVSYSTELPLHDENFESFYSIWSRYDRKNTSTISPAEFVMLMVELYKPMGKFSKKLVAKMCASAAEKGVPRFGKKEIHFSYNRRIVVDRRNLIKQSVDLDVPLREEDKVHIIDAILFIAKNAVFKGNKEQMNNFLIEHDKFNTNLQKKLFKYSQSWKEAVKNEDQTQTSLKTYFVKKVFTKFTGIWKRRHRRRVLNRDYSSVSNIKSKSSISRKKAK